MTNGCSYYLGSTRAIFQRLLKVGREGREGFKVAASIDASASKHSVSEMLHDAHVCGMPKSEFTLRALASFVARHTSPAWH